MKQYLLIDIGGTFIKYSLADEQARKISGGKVPTPLTNMDDLLAAIEGFAAPLQGQFVGCAISMPGRIDTRNGIAHTGGMLSAFMWEQPFAAQVEARLGVPVTIANDGKCAAAAEGWTGALAGVENGLVLALGTGIGGGIILDDAPARHKRNDAAVLSALAVRENGSGAERVLQALTALDTALPSAAQLAARLGMEETRLAPELDALLARGEAAAPMPGRFIASAVLDALWARCEALLTDYHAKNPLHAGIRAAELRQRLFRAVEPERADALLALFVREGKLRFAAERYALADFTVRYTRRQTALRAELLALYRAADLRPERTDRVLARFDAKDRAEAERVLESLLTGGELIALAPRLCLHREVYVCACALVRAYFADHETLTLAAFRDLLGTSRDSALLVLECLDRNDRTRREGDLRRPGRRLYE